MELFAGLPERDQSSGGEIDIPWTLDRAIDVFLNRWAFNWRGERDVIEQELRELIAESERRGER